MPNEAMASFALCVKYNTPEEKSSIAIKQRLRKKCHRQRNGMRTEKRQKLL